jgi:PAS domain-containing protein
MSLIDRCFSESGEHQLQHRLLRGDGSGRVVETTVQGIFGHDGKPLRLVGITQDVTDVAHGNQEKARMSALIELAAEEWRMTCDALDAVLLVLDRNLSVIRLNDRARQLLGVGFDAAIGAEVPAAMIGEPWATIRELATVVGETHVPSNATAYDSVVDKQWDISARSLSHSSIEDERIVVIAHDVSERTQREKVQRDAEVLDSITQFISALSSRAQNSLGQLGDLLSASIESVHLGPDDLRKARAATYDLTRLFRNLDEFAQPFDTNLEPRDLSEVLERSLDSVATLAITRRVGIEAELDEALVVMMNGERLVRLFGGLIRMMVDRSEDGMTIDVSLTEERWQNRPYANVTLAAPKPIFTSSELRWIIDPRVPRLEDEHAARLSIDYRIVEEHGGTMLLANRPDRSSAFVSIRLPIFVKQS